MSIFWCISITNYVTMGITGLALFNVSNKFVCRLISSWLFGIQAFRKTAGFALEISCGWFHPKRDRLPKQRAEATKQKQNCSFFARKFSEEINFVDSGRLLIKKKGRKESSCGFLPSCCFQPTKQPKIWSKWIFKYKWRMEGKESSCCFCRCQVVVARSVDCETIEYWS